MGITFQQNQVALHVNGHAKVLAGAGSGKTTTLIARIKNLLTGGLPPEHICVVMFGADPAEEFTSRLISTLRSNNIPKVYTFHKLGSQFLIPILTKENLLPFAKLEASEKKLKRLCITVLARYLPTTTQQYAAVHDFMSFIDLAKGTLDQPVNVFRKYSFKTEYSFFVDAFRNFERIRQQEKIRFFSDLIYDPVLFLSKNPKHIPLVANKFSQIMIDEYQDINDIQQRMMVMIAGTRAQVMAVGDDDQCIFTWRGANPNYMIKDFDRDFPNPAVFELPETHRYGHQIAMSAYYLISNNRNRTPKLAVSSSSSANTTLSIDMEVPGQRSVPQHIKRYKASNPMANLSDVAVLVRAYSHAVPVEIGLLQEGIPYSIEGGAPIFEAEDIGSIVTSLHLMNKSFERLSDQDKFEYALRFIKSPALGLNFEQHRNLSNQIMRDPMGTPTYIDGMQFEVQDNYVKNRLQRRAAAWRNFTMIDQPNPGEAIRIAMKELGVEHDIQYTSKTPEEAETKRERFEAFIRYADHTGMDLTEYVNHLSFLVAKTKNQKSHGKTDHVLITSIHRSKGLEWPLVIMVGLQEGKFPCYKPDELSLSLLEDERRLFYVGMTRAKHQLIMIAPQDARLLKHLQSGYNQPLENIEPGEGVASRFLYETNALLCQCAPDLVKGDHSVLARIKSPQQAVNYLVKLKNVQAESAQLDSTNRSNNSQFSAAQ